MCETDDRSAAVSAAGTGASRPRYDEVTVRNRGRLPHWERECGCYFVTFRLCDSLPQQVRDEIKIRLARLRAAEKSGRPLLQCEAIAKKRLSSKQFENYLDAGSGKCELKNPEVADLVVNALKLWHGKRYRLLAWCVMPNHVHVVFRLVHGETLSAVVSSWKSYTGKNANKILGRVGHFWQREYYDRLIRDANELQRAIDYVASNPDRANLENWKWVGVADES